MNTNTNATDRPNILDPFRLGLEARRFIRGDLEALSPASALFLEALGATTPADVRRLLVQSVSDFRWFLPDAVPERIGQALLDVAEDVVVQARDAEGLEDSGLGGAPVGAAVTPSGAVVLFTSTPHGPNHVGAFLLRPSPYAEEADARHVGDLLGYGPRWMFAR